MQDVRQALFVPHTNGVQALVDGVPQLPLPLQKGADVSIVPLQTASPHWMFVGCCVQAPAPLQVPVLPQAVLGAHRACGSLAPPATLAQVPGLLVRLQAWQVGQLEVPQQTPSTQLLELHSFAVPQVCPFPFFSTQLPPVPVQ